MNVDEQGVAAAVEAHHGPGRVDLFPAKRLWLDLARDERFRGIDRVFDGYGHFCTSSASILGVR